MLQALAAATTLFVAANAHEGHDKANDTGSTYTLQDDMSYKNFFQAFDFFSGPDPTHGFVQYQTLEAATQQNLIGYYEDQQSIFMGADYKNKDSKGRASVRVESKKAWNQGLLVVDIRHMPDSTCGSWPAFWLLGSGTGPDGKPIEWPNAGEIDILEGVNDETRNAVTLHTSAGCAVDNATAPAMGASDTSMPYLGNMATDNCDVAAQDQDKNVGCSIKAPEPAAMEGVATYGTEFNNAGGGTYAMEWTESSISVWFFPRDNSHQIHINSSSTTLDPSTFGTPLAKFQGQGCDFTERFKDLKIIFDTTFCGEWAGKVWDDTCAAKTGTKTCEEYVQNNPEVFADAYWEVKGLKWYGKAGGVEKRNVVEKRGVEVRKNVRSVGREYRW
jgi:hypothetical protein